MVEAVGDGRPITAAPATGDLICGRHPLILVHLRQQLAGSPWRGGLQGLAPCPGRVRYSGGARRIEVDVPVGLLGGFSEGKKGSTVDIGT